MIPLLLWSVFCLVAACGGAWYFGQERGGDFSLVPLFEIGSFIVMGVVWVVGVVAYLVAHLFGD